MKQPVLAMLFALAALPAEAATAGGSHAGAKACAKAAASHGPGWTHVARSIARGSTIEVFTLRRAGDSTAHIECVYDTRREEVRRLVLK